EHVYEINVFVVLLVQESFILFGRHIHVVIYQFLGLLRGPPLFPYTTLFRSRRGANAVGGFLDVELLGQREHRALGRAVAGTAERSEEHTSELQSLRHLVCRLLREKKKEQMAINPNITTNHSITKPPDSRSKT